MDDAIQYMADMKMFIFSIFNRGVIDKQIKHFLIPKSVQAARFHRLTKVHKAGNPCRPIVNDV